jgi:amino acid transporter
LKDDKIKDIVMEWQKLPIRVALALSILTFLGLCIIAALLGDDLFFKGGPFFIMLILICVLVIVVVYYVMCRIADYFSSNKTINQSQLKDD